MNILKKLIERSGKMALSGLQAAGLAAVVGVAAVGAWQYLSAPSDDATAFNLNNPSNSGNVVYVAGANGGNYAGGNYGTPINYGAGADGKGGSYRLAGGSMQKINQRQAARDQADRILYEEQKAQEDAEKAYAFGATEGFGNASNAANEQESENNPLAALGGLSDLANIKDAVNSQVEAGAAGRGRAASRASGGLAELAKASLGGGSTKAGGADVNMSSGDFASAGNNLRKDGSSREGRRLSGQVGGLLGNNKFARSQDAENNKIGLKGLELLAAKSKKIAEHDGAANEEANVFLGGDQLSGGLLIAGENVTTGQSSGSSDLSSTDTSLIPQQIEEAIGDFVDTAKQREEDAEKVVKWATAAMIVSLVSMCAILILSCFEMVPWIWIAIGILEAAAAAANIGLATKAAQFGSKWGWEGLATGGAAMAGALEAGVLAALIPAAAGAGVVCSLFPLILTGLGIYITESEVKAAAEEEKDRASKEAKEQYDAEQAAQENSEGN